MNFKTALLAASFAASGLAHSATIDWNTWTSNSTGTVDSTPITVTFTGETGSGWYDNYPTWTPSATWADGSVITNAPVASNGIVRLLGGTTTVDTVTFSQAVVNPVFAIWSLGPANPNPSFNFIGATPVLLSGGPSSEYSGSGITVTGNDVYGSEGNGSVEFVGTFNSISWTNPVEENWYGFNVGVSAAVPEPASLGLMAAGLAMLAGLTRRRSAR